MKTKNMRQKDIESISAMVLFLIHPHLFAKTIKALPIISTQEQQDAT